MKKLVFVLIALISATTVMGQLSDDAAQKLMVRNVEINQLNEFLNLTEDELAGIEGSPYVNKEFFPGNIYQNDKLVKRDVFLRYNAFSDEIEMKEFKSSETYGALLKSPDVFVKIINDVYIFVPKNNSNDDGGYFKIVTPGKYYDFYKKITVDFSPPKEGKTAYDVKKPGRFINNQSYYLVSKDGKFTQLPSNKGKMLKVMASKKDEMKQFISQNRINVKNEKDVAKVVNYFNSIL